MTITKQSDMFGDPHARLDASQRRIDLITNAMAARFVEEWHYSNRMPTGFNVCWDLKLEEVRYAVAVLGFGVNPYQHQVIPLEELTAENTWEIKRLCRAEPKHLELSWFVARFIRRVRKQWPTVRVLVAFADPDEGHHGGIYAACNFIRLGETNAEWHLEDEDGQKRHRRYAFRYARRNNISLDQAREQLAVKRVKTAPKIRWVYPMSKRDRKVLVQSKR